SAGWEQVICSPRSRLHGPVCPSHLLVRHSRRFSPLRFDPRRVLSPPSHLGGEPRPRVLGLARQDFGPVHASGLELPGSLQAVPLHLAAAGRVLDDPAAPIHQSKPEPATLASLHLTLAGTDDSARMTASVKSISARIRVWQRHKPSPAARKRRSSPA